MSTELEMDGFRDSEEAAHALEDAIDLAACQGQTVYLLEKGKRIAAVVPVEVAERDDQRLADVLRSPGGRSSVICNLCGHPNQAHRTPGGSGGSRWPLDELDCSGCAAGKCRTPKGEHDHENETAARSGLLSRRHRR